MLIIIYNLIGFGLQKATGTIEGGYQLNYEKTEAVSTWHRDKSQSGSVDSSESSQVSLESDFMWPNTLDVFSEPENRTWETLGHVEMTNDTQFALESNVAIQYLQNFGSILIVSSEVKIF